MHILFKEETQCFIYLHIQIAIHTHRVHALPLTSQGTSTEALPAIVLLGLQFLSLFLPVRLSISAFVLFPLSNYRGVLERKKKKVKIQIDTKKRQTLAGTKFSAAENN